MGIIVQDEHINREGTSVKNYYGSFSNHIRVNKISYLSSKEITKQESESDSNSWSTSEKDIDSSGNIVLVPKLDSDGNTITRPIYDSSKNIIGSEPILTENILVKYYTIQSDIKYCIQSNLVCYVNKDIRLLSLNQKFANENRNLRNRSLRNQRTMYRSIKEFQIEVISDNTNNMYEKLYEKLKTMNLFSNYTDDL